MHSHSLGSARSARTASPRIVPAAARAVAACLAGLVLASTLPAAAGAATVQTAAPVSIASASVPATVFTVDQRLITKRVIKAGQTLTLNLDKLPANAATAKIVVGAEGASKATKISVCAGSVATTACRTNPQLTTPVQSVGYAHVVLDMSKAGRKITLHNSNADAALTVRFASYTVAASTPVPAPPIAVTPVPVATPTPVVTPRPVVTPTPVQVPTSAPIPVPTPTPVPVATAIATPAPAAATTANPVASPAVTVDARLATKQVLKAGQSLTLTLDQLPANAATAKIVVGAEGAAAPTRIAVCAGSTATAECTSKPQLTTPVQSIGYAHVDLDMSRADRRITLHNSAVDAALTVRFASYTVAPTAVQPPVTHPALPVVQAPVAPPVLPVAPPVVASKPGPTNTGVPAGTRLAVHEGDLVITQPNTVIDATEIRGIVWVRAANVTIKRSLITGRFTPTDLALVMVQGATSSVTIEDTEMYAKHPNAHIRGVIGQNFTLRRANVHTVIDQMVIIGDNVTVEDSWLHGNLHYLQDPNYNNTPSHDDNAQISIGNNLKFLRNTLEGSSSASIMVTQDRGPVSNLVLEGNYIGNGGCAVNLAEKRFGAMRGVVIRDNIFARNQVHKNCAMIVDKPTIPLLTLGNNTWADGKPITITPRG